MHQHGQGIPRSTKRDVEHVYTHAPDDTGNARKAPTQNKHETNKSRKSATTETPNKIELIVKTVLAVPPNSKALELKSRKRHAICQSVFGTSVSKFARIKFRTISVITDGNTVYGAVQEMKISCLPAYIHLRCCVLTSIRLYGVQECPPATPSTTNEQVRKNTEKPKMHNQTSNLAFELLAKTHMNIS